jgi:hypothetical protein
MIVLLFHHGTNCFCQKERTVLALLLAVEHLDYYRLLTVPMISLKQAAAEQEANRRKHKLSFSPPPHFGRKNVCHWTEKGRILC